MKISCFLVAAASLIFFGACGSTSRGGGPAELSESEARKIAERALVKEFGREVLKQKPFNAKLDAGVWKISGTLRCAGDSDPAVTCMGGVANIHISAKDGNVLKVDHDE